MIQVFESSSGPSNCIFSGSMWTPFQLILFTGFLTATSSSLAESVSEEIQVFVHQVDSKNSQARRLILTSEHSLEPRFLADQVREGDEIVFTVSTQTGKAIGPFMILRDGQLRMTGKFDRDSLLIDSLQVRSNEGIISETLFHHGRAFVSRSKNKSQMESRRIDFRTEETNLTQKKGEALEPDLNFVSNSDSSIHTLLLEHTKDFSEKIKELREINMRNQLAGRSLASLETLFRSVSEAEMTRGMELQDTEPKEVLRLVAEITGNVSSDVQISRTSSFAFSGVPGDVPSIWAETPSPTRRGPTKDVFQ
jgi:hypothetical protein